MDKSVFVYNPSAFEALIISEVDSNGEYVVVKYSVMTNQGLKETKPKKYKLYTTKKGNLNFFNFRGNRYYLCEFLCSC